MSDFHTNLSIWRGQMVDMLEQNPEQTMWVLCELCGRLSTDELIEHFHMAESPGEFADFLEKLARKIREEMEKV